MTTTHEWLHTIKQTSLILHDIADNWSYQEIWEKVS